MKVNAKKLLESLRGSKEVCGCSRGLKPLYDETGKKIGVTHSPEDADWHDAYFAGLRICRPRGER